MFSKQTLDKVKLAKQYIESTSIIYIRQISEYHDSRVQKSIKLEEDIFIDQYHHTWSRATYIKYTAEAEWL